MERVANAKRRIREGFASMRQKTGWTPEGAGSLFDFFGVIDDPPPCPQPDFDRLARRYLRPYCGLGINVCLGYADPRCKGGNCTRHCVRWCGGKCIGVKVVPRPVHQSTSQSPQEKKPESPTSNPAVGDAS